MEVKSGSSSHDKARHLARGWGWIKALSEKFKSKVVEIGIKTKKVGKDDPRRIVHSLKVGLALTLVSLFYYYQPLYNNFGVSAMWAVMTVVVVFEFSVGATLGKGLNRGVATLVAGAFGVGAHHLASLSGNIGEPILLGFFVFLQAAVSTFVRFFPKVKSRYDYGLLIFILTFSLIFVSGFRNDEILELAYKRLSTVIIGGATCLIISILVCPVWAGQDLHNLIATNMDKLGNFLQGFREEYFNISESKENGKSFLEEYKSVLNSKTSEESLANFARWEPGHGWFQFRHPWKQYLKIGTLTRQCAYRIEALSGYLNADIQVSLEIRSKVDEEFKKISMETGSALKELALAIISMTKPTSADLHLENSQFAVKNLNCLLKSGLWEDAELLQIIPVATVASLLIDVVNCTEKISESVYELASMAHFKNKIESTVSPEESQRETVKSTDCPNVVITVLDESSSVNPENRNPSSIPKSNGSVNIC